MSVYVMLKGVRVTLGVVFVRPQLREMDPILWTGTRWLLSVDYEHGLGVSAPWLVTGGMNLCWQRWSDDTPPQVSACQDCCACARCCSNGCSR